MRETHTARPISAGWRIDRRTFLKLMGIVAGGWQMARAALAAEKKLNAGDKAFYAAKLATARFYADQVLVQASALRDTVTKGAAAVMAVPEDSMLAA